MNELIGNLRAAFAERLRASDWMDEPTRAAALAKLETFEPRIGHPVVWIDYSQLPGRPRRPARQHGPRGRVQLEPAALAPAQPGRPAAVGDERADHQRLLQSAAQPDHLPGRHPAAALLRSQRRSGGQLRRDRRGDRPRDRPRLRRSGPPLRSAGAGARLVDARSPPQRFTERTTRLGQQYGSYRPLPDLDRQRPAHHGREYRRPRRAGNGLCRLSPPRRPAWRAAGDRRPDRRPALLPRLGAGLAQQGPRGLRCASAC